VISPTQSSGTPTPPFSPNQIGSAVAMTQTASLPTEGMPTASLQPPTDTPSSAASFVPGNPTATPLGSEITDPNFIAGVAAFDADNYEQAVVLMSAVIASNPGLAPPYRYRATSYWYLDNCASGMADAEKAVSINPDYAAAWAARGLLYNTCFGNQAQALQDYEKALSIDPSLAFVHMNLGIYYYEQGDYQKAFDEYNLARVIDPTRSAAWAAMSGAQGALGRYGECIENASKAIEMNGEEWLAYSSRAFCYTRIGNVAAATADYEIYLSQSANDSKAWYSYAISQSDMGDLQGAMDSYTRSLELDPSYYPANINRGLVYTDLGRYNEALADFNRALESGDIPAAYSGRGTVYYWLKRYDEAISDLELATEMMPNRPHSYCMLALTYFETGRYQDSLEAAERVNQIEPGCGGNDLLEKQARSHYALRDYEQAILYMNKALAVKPYSLGYYYRGIIFYDAGKKEQAISDLNQFLSYIGDDMAYGSEIADAKRRLKQLKP